MRPGFVAGLDLGVVEKVADQPLVAVAGDDGRPPL